MATDAQQATDPRLENADLLHWLRGELVDILGVTCGDDQYPWEYLIGELRRRVGDARSDPPREATLAAIRKRWSVPSHEYDMTFAADAEHDIWWLLGEIQRLRGAPEDPPE